MLKRKAYDELLTWKNSAKRKALCIIGARQIGKTTLIREFGRNEYEYFAEINFVTDKNAEKIFEGKLTAEEIIVNLTAYLQKKLEPGKSLILFDEVQECPQVRTAIKFLVEDGRFDYIESGSLLGVRYKDVISYPVGYEQIVQMYPLDFEEYLWANGVQQDTVKYLKDCYDNKVKVSETVHNTMCKLFYNELNVDTSKIQSDYIWERGVIMLLLTFAGAVSAILVGLLAAKVSASSFVTPSPL